MRANVSTPFKFLVVVRVHEHRSREGNFFEYSMDPPEKKSFLHHPQILHFSKAIIKSRLVDVHLHALRVDACMSSFPN